MNIQDFLQSRPIVKTDEVATLFGVTPRTLLRWQDKSIYQNPMPKPLFAAKGSQVFIQGKFTTRKYTDNNGIERYATSIQASQMQMLGGVPDDCPF